MGYCKLECPDGETQCCICCEKQDDIASIIYSTLDHMYCDNCRFNSEIKESDNGEWNCDECHRKYNGWGVSMQESNKIAKEILKQLGE